MEIEEEKEIDELWEKFRRTSDLQIREKLVLKYAPLVKYVAGRLAICMPPNVEFDDLVSYGIFGLIDAIDKFDPDRDIKFKTYAASRIRGAIIDELRALDWVPRSTRTKARQVEQALADFELRHGRPATDKELAYELGVNEEDVVKIIQEVSGTTLMSFEDVWYSGNDSDDITLADTIEGPDKTRPEYHIEKEEIKRILIDAIKELPERERMVITLYYYEELTLKEIGAVLNVTESRVSQLHTKAVLRLRGKLKRNIKMFV
ncbi:MAG: RNA polymerase sigma factor WhiG [Candidatus Hydrogenedentota bacterium]